MPNPKSHQSLKKLIGTLNDGQFHSGESLGKGLKLTRAAIWKIIQKAEQLDIPIESVVGTGYKLKKPISLLDEAHILDALAKTTSQQIQALECFDQIDSTHHYLLNTLQKKQSGYRVCLAEYQTGGTGRYGRKWHSPFGQHIALSLVGTINRELSELSGLSLAIACALIKALNVMGFNAPFQLKWPNDILVEHKKLAGILVSLKGDSHGQSQCVVSIGMNANILNRKISIDQPWVDLAQLNDKPIDRNHISARLIEEIIDTIALFEQAGFLPCKALWQKHDCLLGQPISLKVANKIIHGTGQGVDDQGHFLLKPKNSNAIQSFAIGETHIAK